jgi:hypothetical protein
MKSTSCRFFVGLQVALLVSWYLLPAFVTPDEPRMKALLGMSGYGAIIPVQTLYVLSIALIAIQLTGLFALWMLKPWGKWILLSSTAGMLVSSSLGGVGVEPPVTAPFGFLVTLVQGVLLAIAFLSNSYLKK